LENLLNWTITQSEQAVNPNWVGDLYAFLQGEDEDFLRNVDFGPLVGGEPGAPP
jgi:hypothetical protein